MTEIIKLKGVPSTVFCYTYPDGMHFRWTVRGGHRIAVLMDEDRDYVMASEDLNGVEFAKLLLRIIDERISGIFKYLVPKDNRDVQIMEGVYVYTDSMTSHWRGPDGIWSLIIFDEEVDLAHCRTEVQKWLRQHDKDSR